MVFYYGVKHHRQEDWMKSKNRAKWILIVVLEVFTEIGHQRNNMIECIITLDNFSFILFLPMKRLKIKFSNFGGIIKKKMKHEDGPNNPPPRFLFTKTHWKNIKKWFSSCQACRLDIPPHLLTLQLWYQDQPTWHYNWDRAVSQFLRYFFFMFEKYF